LIVQPEKFRPVRVCHVITGLNTGGAETALYNLLKAANAEQFTMSVVSLSDIGSIGTRIARLGVSVESLGMRSGGLPLAGLIRLRTLLSRIEPDVIQSWMYHANLLALLASRSLRKSIPVIWNVRHCIYDLNNEPLNTRWVIQISRMLSGLADGIIYNSRQARQQHEALGYSPTRAIRIPNGFDLQTLRAESTFRDDVRTELGIPSDALVLGHVGRFHPMKDHVNFLQAVSQLTLTHSRLHIIMCGQGVEKENSQLAPYLQQIDPSRMHLLGERDDVPHLLSAMDIFCSSSWSEAFPNVLGEAMAVQLPCVTTGVGDSGCIVGDTGIVVPPKDPGALAGALTKLLELPADERNRLGEQARQRIEQNYSISHVTKTYEGLYHSARGSN
jgi:glycosyltransferase involved in cell wall biosynthesis